MQADGAITLEPSAVRYYYVGPGHIDASHPAVRSVRRVLDATIIEFEKARSD